MSKLISDHQ
jgi:acyl-CoA reductase-like NAD-dependent aldehyde dehydrogenase